MASIEQDVRSGRSRIDTAQQDVARRVDTETTEPAPPTTNHPLFTPDSVVIGGAPEGDPAVTGIEVSRWAPMSNDARIRQAAPGTFLAGQLGSPGLVHDGVYRPGVDNAEVVLAETSVLDAGNVFSDLGFRETPWSRSLLRGLPQVAMAEALTQWDVARSNAAVQESAERFGLDLSTLEGISAAQAHVWAGPNGRGYLEVFGPLWGSLPADRTEADVVAQAVARYELNHPGARQRAISGSAEDIEGLRGVMDATLEAFRNGQIQHRTDGWAEGIENIVPFTASEPIPGILVTPIPEDPGGTILADPIPEEIGNEPLITPIPEDPGGTVLVTPDASDELRDLLRNEGFPIHEVSPDELVVLSQGFGNGHYDLPSTTSDPDVRSYITGVPRRRTPGNRDADFYEVGQTGPYNYTISGGGAQLNIDGFRGRTILDAKHVGDPERSPYVPGSSVPDEVRDVIRNSELEQFQRALQIIESGATPFDSFEVVTNNAQAAAYFRELLREAGFSDQPGDPLYGTVVVRP